jgi:transposase
MFALTSSCCYYLYRQPTDMRKSFDGLSGLIRSQLRRQATTGEVFIFINHRRDRIKLLRWEEGGFILYYKRLESGTFELPSYDSNSLTCTMSWAQLVMMVEGISMTHIKQRKRFSKTDRYQQFQA